MRLCGKVVLNLNFEEWAEFGYLGMGNGTPGRMLHMNKAKEKTQGFEWESSV